MYNCLSVAAGLRRHFSISFSKSYHRLCIGIMNLMGVPLYEERNNKMKLFINGRDIAVTQSVK